RIIPSNVPPRGSQNASGSVFDQGSDEEDAQKGSHSSAKPTTSGASGTAAPTYPASGSVVFGGTDRSDDGSTKARVGPLERDRQVRNTGGGNSGVRVRIIPANAPTGSSRDSNSAFEQRD